MINSLTKEQEARFGQFRDKWLGFGLSTERANRKEAEMGIVEIYEIAGLKKPKIVWCDSPLSQGITRMIVQKLENDGELKKGIGKNVENSVRDSVWDSIWASVRASVEDSVWDSIRDSIRDSVRDSVGDSIRDSVGASVRDSVWDSVGASVWDSGYGQHDAGWLAFYDFFSEVCGLKKETQKLSGLWKVSQNAGWFLPHANICWISERHITLFRNSQGRLHNENGMALSYPDGWGVYALNGVRFPEKLYKEVTSGEMPFEKILAIEDIDQRTQAMKFGDPQKFLEHSKAMKMDERIKFAPQGQQILYQLYKIPKGEVFTEDAYYLLYDDPSTIKKYMSGVIPAKTVAGAMAWKFSVDEKSWENLEPLKTES